MLSLEEKKNFEMKIGDKVMCIKRDSGYSNSKLLKIGSFYTIFFQSVEHFGFYEIYNTCPDGDGKSYPLFRTKCFATERQSKLKRILNYI
jgi:hypothetical protein